MTKTVESYDARLAARFGFDGFRPWQREAVVSLLDDHQSVLVVAPTGGGKSLCYQFPATELAGTTLVVSPLIALMVDQVDSLTRRGIAATYLASTLSHEEQESRWRGLEAGKYKIVYIAPERLSNRYTLDRLSRSNIPFVAIDEAHCISQWGHDFRPDYLVLDRVLAQLKPAHVLACTATATPAVREEILKRLKLPAERSRVILRGFARPGLHLSALEVNHAPARWKMLRATLAESRDQDGTSIVYTATRKNAERAAEKIESWGYRAAAYHAGLDPDTRMEISRGFSEGDFDVIAATNAFGMGIDRPDIRAVVHLQAPGSIEAYYQEVGRAGRDGEPARGVLMTSAADIGLRRRLSELGVRSSQQIERSWELFLDLLRYVEAGSCRHDFILRYFGDDHEVLGGCGHCDVCERLARGDEGFSEDDAALLVRKALSGVARARQSVGLTAVADMLLGKKDRKLERWGLDQLSTFGLLADFDRDWIIALLRRLLTANLITLVGEDFPMPWLTDAGVEVMQGQRKPLILLPRQVPETPALKKAPKGTGRRRRRGRTASNDAPLSAVDAPLFERLRALRKEIADEEGKPPFVVFHDRTLAEMAAARPGTREALLSLAGVGPQKLERYGEAFLQAIEAFGCETANAS